MWGAVVRTVWEDGAFLIRDENDYHATLKSCDLVQAFVLKLLNSPLKHLGDMSTK
uniref:Uncharacterized protein n=1 Tax=Anguilla anguilla TaxID=7936 RepID=A0A0E9WI64_ANGAN